MKFQLIDYFDVWGNEEEGWEVNNQAKTDVYIDIDTKNDDETDILVKLVEAEFLNPKAINEIYVNWLEVNFIELELKKVTQQDDQKPIGKKWKGWHKMEITLFYYKSERKNAKIEMVNIVNKRKILKMF